MTELSFGPKESRGDSGITSQLQNKISFKGMSFYLLVTYIQSWSSLDKISIKSIFF